MATFFEQVGLLVQANVGDVIENALKRKSPQVVKIESANTLKAIQAVEAQIALFEAQVSSAKRDEARLTTEVTADHEKLQNLLKAGDEAHAQYFAQEELRDKAALENTEGQEQALEQQLTRLHQIHGQLTNRKAQLDETYQKLTTALKMAQTQGVVLHTLQDVDSLLNNTDYNNYVQDAEQQADVVGRQIDQELARAGTPNTTDVDPEVAALMAQTKAELQK